MGISRAFLVPALVLGLSTTALAANKPLAGQALVDAYTKCWDHFNGRAWEAFKACYAADAVSTGSGLPEGRGPASVDLHARPFVASFPDMEGRHQLVLARGSMVASITLLTGTNSGSLETPAGKLPPTGKKIGMLAAHVVQSGGGAAAKREWLVMDNGTMAAQLGLSPMPARPAIPTGVGKPIVVVASGSETEKKNLAAVRKMYRQLAGRDRTVFQLLADDVVDTNPSMPADIVGKAAVERFVAGFWQMSSDMKLSMPTVFAAGDYVVALGHFGGTNDGDHPAMGLKKTGKRFKTEMIEITKWQDGKLVQLWPFFDGADLAKQLGLIPPPAAQAAARTK